MIRQIARLRVSIGKSILMVTVITVCVVLMSGIVGYFRNNLGIRNTEYVIYILLIVLGLYIVKKYLTEYRYSLFDDEVIIDRIVGNRVEALLVLRVREIEEHGLLSEMSEDKRQYVERIIKANIRKIRCHYILFHRNGKRQMLVYNPTDEFAEALKKGLKDQMDHDNTPDTDNGDPQTV